MANKLTLIAATVITIAATYADSSSASADPQPNFPDTSSYVEADSQQYEADDPRVSSLFFTTPDGLWCHMFQNAGCSGKLPGTSGIPNKDGCSSVEKSGQFDGDGAPYVYKPYTARSCDFKPGNTKANLLNIGQKLTLDKATCVVGANSLTACISEYGHGFVLQPSGSWLF
jgi:hypothetical protein